MAVVAALRVAPVKGLATVTRDSVHLDSAGVAEDRRLFMLDQHGKVVTLRSHPELVQVRPDLDLGRKELRASLADGTFATTSLTNTGEQVHTELYGKARVGHVLAGDVAEAVSAIAGEPIRLVLADRTGVGWDEGPVSILGRASAAAVGGEHRDRARYRMLIELDDTTKFEEDGWVGHDLELGAARVKVTHQLVRCAIITQSPVDGRKDWDGLRALAEQGRRELCLGVIAEVVIPGEVRVGSQVEVLDPA